LEEPKFGHLLSKEITHGMLYGEVKELEKYASLSLRFPSLFNVIKCSSLFTCFTYKTRHDTFSITIMQHGNRDFVRLIWEKADISKH
jgi:hypothetical protein